MILRKFLSLALGWALVIGLPPIVWAQEMELVTDRPDQTESTNIVPVGYIQVETGGTFVHDKNQGVKVRSYEFPGTLVRAGVMDGAELRIGWGGYAWQKTEDNGISRIDGGSDMEIGSKIHLWQEKGLRPEGALLTGISLPTGSQNFTSERVDPSFRFNMSHTLNDRLSLGYNLGATWGSSLNDNLEDRDRAGVFNYTTSLGIGLSEKLGMFVEFFGDVPVNARGRPQNSFDGGFTYKLQPNVQLDISGGVGISEDANDFFAGMGISVRWPS